jgi:anti-sigma regulatory factor (Ser/Thr protein kinase)
VRSAPARGTRVFRHQAAFYRGLDDFTRTVAPFVGAGLALGEPVLVAGLPDRIGALRDVLGPRADEVAFVDMATLGRNPARIIPAWRRFVEGHAGRPVRGVGEPVWAGRRAAELEECRLHESLLNVAFDEVGTDFRLLCPYDASALPGEVLADAARTHPVVGSTEGNPAYGGHAHALAEFERPLPEPPADAELIAFGAEDLAGLRSVVHRLCEMTNLTGDAVEDLVLATHELATNSVRHGGGEGVLRGWREPGALVLEVSDRGVMRDPLVGREEAAALAEGGRGVWMANQLCDLVQVRSSAQGTTVRLHSWLAQRG